MTPFFFFFAFGLSGGAPSLGWLPESASSGTWTLESVAGGSPWITEAANTTVWTKE